MQQAQLDAAFDSIAAFESANGGLASTAPPAPAGASATIAAAPSPSGGASGAAAATAEPAAPELPCTACGGGLGKGAKSKKRKAHPLLGLPVCDRCLGTYESGEFTISAEDNHEIYCRCVGAREGPPGGNRGGRGGWKNPRVNLIGLLVWKLPPPSSLQ